MNQRRATYTRKPWIVILGYLLDLKEPEFVKQVVAPFAQDFHWNTTDRSLARILVKCVVEDPLDVPRSLVIKRGRELDGEGRSWTCPVYMFNSEVLGVAPGDEEDPPPFNGNPHPYHGPIVPGEQELVQHLADQAVQQLIPEQQPMQVDPQPDQASNAGSVTQGSEQDIQITQFTIGPAEPAEIQVLMQNPPFTLGSAGSDERQVPLHTHGQQQQTVSHAPEAIQDQQQAPSADNNQSTGLNQEITATTPHLDDALAVVAHAQVTADQRPVMAHTLINSLQQILNSQQVQVQYRSTEEQGNPMIHLTLRVPGLVTTFQLPGTIQQQHTTPHHRATITEAASTGLPHMATWANKPPVTRTYYRRWPRINKDRTSHEPALGIFQPKQVLTPQQPVKRKLDTPVSEEKFRRSLRKLKQNDGFKANSAGTEHPMTRSRVKALAARTTASKKKTSRSRVISETTSKLHLPNLVSDAEFPGLSDIANNASHTYPPISVAEL